jgi:hypothetical protein
VPWDTAITFTSAIITNGENYPQPYSFTAAGSLSYSTTLSTSPSSPQAIEALEFSLNMPAPGATYVKYFSIPVSYSVPANETLTLYAYLPIDDDNGTCDIYGTNGYLGAGTFDANLPEANVKFMPVYSENSTN